MPALCDDRNICTILVGKARGKIALGRSRHKWEGSIKIDLGEKDCEVMHYVRLA